MRASSQPERSAKSGLVDFGEVAPPAPPAPLHRNASQLSHTCGSVVAPAAPAASGAAAFARSSGAEPPRGPTTGRRTACALVLHCSQPLGHTACQAC